MKTRHACSAPGRSRTSRSRRRRTGLVSLAVSGVLCLFAAFPLQGAWAFKQGDMPDFVVSCPLSHSAPDDPIVDPGQPGVSHLHDFFGNVSTDAFSTYASLQAAGTTCDRVGDTAAYWMPAVYQDGVKVADLKATVYYRDMAPDPTTIHTVPAGLKMVAGNHAATTPQRPLLVGWACRHAMDGLKGRWTSDVPTCRPGENLVFRVRFPDCWNGVDLDSANHMSHMAYSKNGVCSTKFPVEIPRISMTVAYASTGGPGVTLSSGSALTGHADFFNAWDQAALDDLVTTCLQAGVHCGFGTAADPSPTPPFDG